MDFQLDGCRLWRCAISDHDETLRAMTQPHDPHVLSCSFRYLGGDLRLIQGDHAQALLKHYILLGRRGSFRNGPQEIAHCLLALQIGSS